MRGVIGHHASNYDVLMPKQVYMYADETGNLDFSPGGKSGASTHFGFGTATFTDRHGHEIFEATKARMKLSHEGTHLINGFHATNDSRHIRNHGFALLKKHEFRFDSTFLLKENAYDYIKKRGEMYLYKLAWFLHFKEIAKQVADPDDTLWVTVGTFGTKKRAAMAAEALSDVCSQVDRDIRLSIWPAATSWGLQCADYALWSTAKVAEGKECEWYEECVRPHSKTRFFPWGKKIVPAIP